MAETQKEKEERLNARGGGQLPKTNAKGTAMAPKLMYRGSVEFRHDLFKLGISTMLKNVSYKKFEPDLHKVPHVHFFHSHDMKGKKLLHSASVGGHFHEVTVEWNEDPTTGELSIKSMKCGPPLRTAQRRLKKGGVKSVIEPVRFETGEDDTFDEAGDVVEGRAVTTYEYDRHVHDIEYMGSEMLSPEKLKRQQESDKAALRGMVQAQPDLLQNPGEAKPGPASGDEGEGTGDPNLTET